MMNIETMKMREEIKNHLTEGIIPFWKGMRDDEFGGYYGYLDYDLNLDKKAEKGCILNSRITWFFSNAYTLLKDESLLDEAKHGYAFLKDYCLDKEYGSFPEMPCLSSTSVLWFRSIPSVLPTHYSSPCSSR